MGEDDYTIADAAHAATRMLRHGVSDAEIKDLLPEHYRERAFEIARLRKKASERFEDPWELWFDARGLRYATPDVVARARARRLADHGDVAIDAACGVGIQLAFLASVVDEAVGVEIDPDTADMARRNLKALGSKAPVVEGDCLAPEIVDEVPRADVVVCDPARDPEAEERTLDGLTPDLRKVHTTYGTEASAWCYELPPMIDRSRVRQAFEGELEYTSLGGDLNRLALYGGQAKRVRRSALTLPSAERLDVDDPNRELARVDEAKDFVHRVDRTIVQADLLEQLAERIQSPHLLANEHPRRFLLTSDEPAESAFVESFEVLDTHHWNLMGLREKLKRLGAGSVTLRVGIDPQRYWEVRNALEEGLSGSRNLQLFRFLDTGLIVDSLEESGDSIESPQQAGES